MELPSMQALTTAPPDVRVELPRMQALTTAPPDVRVELPRRPCPRCCSS